MNQITDIQPQKKDPNRVNIYLDGQFAFGLSREAQIVNKVKIGESLTADQVKKLIFTDQVERLYDKALKFLSYRPRSEKEVRDNLIQKLRQSEKGEEEKKTTQDSVEEVIKKLKTIGQINDVEFATWWAEQRTKFKKMSPRLIKGELWKKGIAKEIVEETLSEELADPFQLALQAGEKKFHSYKNLPPKDFKIKMSRYLATKGFDWEVINKVVDTLLQSR